MGGIDPSKIQNSLQNLKPKNLFDKIKKEKLIPEDKIQPMYANPDTDNNIDENFSDKFKIPEGEIQPMYANPDTDSIWSPILPLIQPETVDVHKYGIPIDDDSQDIFDILNDESFKENIKDDIEKQIKKDFDLNIKDEIKKIITKDFNLTSIPEIDYDKAEKYTEKYSNADGTINIPKFKEFFESGNMTYSDVRSISGSHQVNPDNSFTTTMDDGTKIHYPSKESESEIKKQKGESDNTEVVYITTPDGEMHRYTYTPQEGEDRNTPKWLLMQSEE